MVARCAGPLAVGMMAEGTGAAAQAATNRKRHRLTQRTGHLATAVVRIALLLIVEPPLLGRARRVQPHRLILRGKTRSIPLLWMPGRCCSPWNAPCVVVPMAYHPFSLRAC